MLALRTGRLESGQRTGLAFTSQTSLMSALGPSQHWVRLSEPALRAMLIPLGVAQIRLDPLAVHAPSHGTEADSGRQPAPAASTPPQPARCAHQRRRASHRPRRLPPAPTNPPAPQALPG
jgi:hypothetical protein